MWLYCCCCWRARRKHYNEHIQFQRKPLGKLAVSIPTLDSPVVHKAVSLQQPHPTYYYTPSSREDQNTLTNKPLLSRPRIYSEHFSASLLPSPSYFTKRKMSESNTPTLHYSLFYDIQLHVLRVSLSQITGLVHPHNCYVSLYLHPDKRVIKETKIVGKSSSPVFDEVFEFRSVVPGELPSRVLVATVMSREKFSRNMLGMVVMTMKTANLYGSSCSAEIDTMATSTEYLLNGEVSIAMCYQPEVGLLQGVLLKARNLRKMDLIGTADPYVKLYLLHNGERKAKWRSSIKRNAPNPVFNEPFQFVIRSYPMDELSLSVVVMDYDRFSRDEVVGVVMVSKSSNDPPCQRMWREVISSPGQQIAQWLPLQTDSSGKSNK